MARPLCIRRGFMKRIISLLLAVMLILSVAAMAGCNKGSKKADTGSSSNASSSSNALSAASLPEGAVPNATTAEGKATGYYKLDKDEKGRVVRNYTYDSLGKLQGSIGYEYDDNGFVSKEIHYDTEGKITSQIALEHNESGFETKRTTMDAQGKVKSTVVTTYNEDGTTTHTRYDANGKEIK